MHEMSLAEHVREIIEDLSRCREVFRRNTGFGHARHRSRPSERGAFGGSGRARLARGVPLAGIR